MKYEGTALHSDLPNGRISGYIDIQAGKLVFSSDSGKSFSMNLVGISITQGGSGNRYIYFQNSADPQLTLYTDNRSILDHEAFREDGAKHHIASNLKHSHRLLWLSFFVFSGLLVAAIISFYIFRVEIVEKIADAIPPSVEQSVTDELKQSILSQKREISNHSIDSQLQLIVKPLISQIPHSEFTFNFTIIEDSTLNAFALPGGTIMIHSGLIMKAKNAEEVAGVLAHEISHVTRRHHLRGIIANLGMFTLVRGFIGDVAGLSADIIAIGATLESLSYSRDFEREADQSGYDLLSKSKIDPVGMIDFFKTLKAEHGSTPNASFLSTHPDVEERIKTLTAMYGKNKSKSYTAIFINFDAFKNDIQKRLNQ